MNLKKSEALEFIRQSKYDKSNLLFFHFQPGKIHKQVSTWICESRVLQIVAYNPKIHEQTRNIQKQQDKIDGVMQNCPIPADVYAWATSQLQKIKMSSVGRRNDTPTLPDIYYTLVLKALRYWKTRSEKACWKTGNSRDKSVRNVDSKQPNRFDPSPLTFDRFKQTQSRVNTPSQQTENCTLQSVSVAMMRLAIRYRHEWMSSDEIGQ